MTAVESLIDTEAGTTGEPPAQASPDDGPSLSVLHIGTVDEGGGAAAVASGLARAHRLRGCRVRQMVGRKIRRDPDTLLLPDDRRWPYRVSGYAAVQSGLQWMAGRHPNRGWGLASRSLRALTHPSIVRDRSRGLEDFEFPGTYSLFDVLGGVPDIVHCHNLHGGYFDLRALPWLSHQAPTVVTLHDMWLLTGHCAHSLSCERWQTGCGHCPDLRLYPAVRRDATAENWERKQDAFRRSRLYVAAPSRWLLEKADRSALRAGVRNAVVIPHGVDLRVFEARGREEARIALGIPASELVVLLTVVSQGSMWKDDGTVRRTLSRIAETTPDLRVTCIALGRDVACSQAGQVSVRSVPYQSDPAVVAQYYRAADLYLHSARADTFPSAVVEALASGTPVVATNVGGIPEQIVSAELDAVRSDVGGGLEQATGVLVPPTDPEAMARATVTLLTHAAARRLLGANAARDARRRFNLDVQAIRYLEWYRHVVADWTGLQGRRDVGGTSSPR